jgi:hypothetical protein
VTVNRCYFDLLALTSASPLWFDEHAVPRFCEFSPDQIGNIYAAECCLLLIACQACERQFLAAVSIDEIGLIRLGHQKRPPPPWLTASDLEYGDPPNVECCPAGPTMNSVPLRVVEAWDRHEGHEWKRRPEREGPIECEWMKGRDHA